LRRRVAEPGDRYQPASVVHFYVLATVLRKLGKADESRQAMAAFSKLERETNELDQRRRDWAREEDRRAPAVRPEAVAHE
jgi:hypothetical protein